MLGLLSLARINDVSIAVVTRPPGNYPPKDQPGVAELIQTITDAGAAVIRKANIHQKFAVFDQNVVWCGSINLLSFGASQESIMRLENMEIAGELLLSVEWDARGAREDGSHMPLTASCAGCFSACVFFFQ